MSLLSTAGHTGPTLVTALAATGTTQATARILPMKRGFVEVVATSPGAGILLPAIGLPTFVFVQNSGANPLRIYPQPGGTIGLNPPDVPLELDAGAGVMFWASSLVNWYSVGGPSGGTTYAAPAFTSFALSGQSSPIEVGATLSGSSRTFTWTDSHPANIAANSLTIDDTTASTTLASGLADTGTHTLSFSNITKTAPATQTWTISGTNTLGNPFSRGLAVNWLYRVYAGTNAASSLTANQIKALADFGGLAAGFAGDYSYADPGSAAYYYLAFPAEMGAAAGFLDTTPGDAPLSVDMTELAPVSVTNAQGVATSYTVWRTTNSFSGAFSMRVS